MRTNILEVCIDCVESAIAAKEGGADRLELCANLIIGGTTPGTALFEEIRKQCNCKVHVLIRPRFGDFLYSDYEFAVMKREIGIFRKLGADGVVIGALKADGSLDALKMEQLIEAAEGMGITLHRAFDVSADPFQSLETAKKLGVHTILTSGQEESCIKGKALLKRLKEKSQGKVEIMAGAGVTPAGIEELIAETGISCYHMSGKRIRQSNMQYRKEGVPMGLKGFSEFEIWRTDKEQIKKAREVLDKVFKK